MPDILQASFVGGEINPALYGHVDLARYGTSLKTCRNYLVRPYGGIWNRPGFRYVANAKNATINPPNLITFSPSASYGYVLEFGDYYVRFHQFGAPVLVSSPAAYVAGTTYAAGQIVLYNGIAYVSVVGNNTGNTPGVVSPSWSDVTGSWTGYWYPLTASGTRWILELPTPYLATEAFQAQVAQSVDVMTICHPNHQIMQLSWFGGTQWSLSAFSLTKGPFQNVATDTQNTVSCSAATGYGVTVTSTKAIFSPNNVGQLLYLEQKDFGTSWQPGITVAIGAIMRSVGNYYQALNAGTTGTNIPIGTTDNWNDGAVTWKYLHPGWGVISITGYTDAYHITGNVTSYVPDSCCTTGGGGTYGSLISPSSYANDGNGMTSAYCASHGLTIGTYGVGKVHGVADPYGVDFTCNFQVPDANHVHLDCAYQNSRGTITTISCPAIYPPLAAGNGGTWKYAFGSFGAMANSGAPCFPGAVSFYQQRLVLAGTTVQPDTIWMSRTNAYNDFSVSPVVEDDDEVSFILGGQQQNIVRSILPLAKLLMVTSGSVYAVGQGQGDIITPSNINCVMQGYNGGSQLPMLGIAYSTLYVATKGNLIRELNYQFVTDNYVATDMTVFAHHMLDGHYIEDWSWHQAPHMVVWMVREDGTLLGMTYMKEQEVNGWHHHDTQGLFQSVTNIAEGMEDILYAVVTRTINGTTLNYIERMDTRLVADQTKGFFVDCGGTFDGSISPTISAPWTSQIMIGGGTNWDQTDSYLILTLQQSSNPWDGAYFKSTDVGDQIHITGTDGEILRLTVIQYVSSSALFVRPDRTVPVGDRSVYMTGWAWARQKVQIPWLPNTTVVALVDGCVQGPFTTDSSGWLTLTTPGFRCQVGLQYTSDAELLPLSPPEQGSSTVGQFKLISEVHVILQESRGLWAGGDADHLLEVKIRDVVSGSTNVPPNLVTDKLMVSIESTWDDNGTVFLRHSDPTPIGILAAIPSMEMGNA